jgi:uncharacterized protein YbjT (DUF2867 family)
LVTGVTGYVGNRLWRRLEAEGRAVRCLARDPRKIRRRPGGPAEVVRGDVLQPETLAPALEGVEAAYYLIHSLASKGDFEKEELAGARNFGAAAKRAGVRRIVYLGGLGQSSDLSPHLRSRHQVGEALRESGVPVLEFRASIVLGAGSLSFEMIRSLVERLPVLITPRWVRVEAQPIAVDDLIDYLVAALDPRFEENRVFEIGGPDRVSYEDLMREYARQRGLRRVMLRVPLLTPGLSSLWLGIVTPLYARVGRKLIESIKHPTVVQDKTALAVFPIRPLGMREAIARAIQEEEQRILRSEGFDELVSEAQNRLWGGARVRNCFVDSRRLDVDVEAGQAFGPIRRIGGKRGEYAYTGLWRLRGLLDRLVGGVGIRRGRPASQELRVGDALDFWRVEAYEADRRLLLRAEMKLPGRAWLEFRVEPRESGARIRQTAVFDPLGVIGLVYWYLLYPVHLWVFRGLLRNIARAAASEGRRPCGGKL